MPRSALSWLTAILTLTVGGGSAAAQSSVDAAAPPRTVLAIYAGAIGHPSNLVLDQSIREALAAPPEKRINFYAEYLDSEGAFAPIETAAHLRDYLAAKYGGQHIDVVIVPSDVALRFALANRDRLFPDASIVWSGVADPQTLDQSRGVPITGVRVGVAYAETLKLALALHPDVRQVFVVAKTTGGIVTREALERELGNAPAGVSLTYLDEPTIPQLLTAISHVPPRSLVLYLWHQPTETSNFVFPDTVARMVAEVSPVPVYGTSDFYTGLGVVGGVVRLTADTGRRLGQMTRQILDGTRAQDIAIERARLVPIFDWRQLRRWHVDTSKLPPDADIQFMTPTVWESYRWYIIAMLVIVIAQCALIAGLLAQRARRRRAESEVKVSEAALRTSYLRIRRLAGRLIHAQEAARSGIARDLHDDFCQQLALVGIEINALKRSHGRIEDAPSQHALEELEQRTQAMFDGVRRLSHDLHPESLRLLGLGPALKSYFAEMEKRQDVHVTFTSDGDLTHLHPDISVCLFRIAQEAVRNGVVHGHARHFTVALSRSGESVDLTIDDDGSGFDIDAVRAHGGGLGLVSMEERAHAVGGSVRIVSRAGLGTTVQAQCPSEMPEDAAIVSGERRSGAR